jgi:hypothetical protein
VRESREFASEIKFQVADFAGETILEWARDQLSPDPNAQTAPKTMPTKSPVSLFDTEEYDVYHRNGSWAKQISDSALWSQQDGF